MPHRRPPIPRPVERSILIEAGHRCAIPTCHATPVEIAHIVPWATVRQHTYENLIALCPTCHARYDRGEIDRLSMKKYKENLRAVSASRTDEMTQLRSSQVEAFCNLVSALTFWEQTIREIALAELEEESCSDMDSQAQRRARALVEQSRDNRMNAWLSAKDGMRQFELSCKDDFFRRAELLYDSLKSLADDVFDGLWPSTHAGADDHEDLARHEEELFKYASETLEIEIDELYLRTATTWRDSATRLGGTGKKF